MNLLTFTMNFRTKYFSRAHTREINKRSSLSEFHTRGLLVIVVNPVTIFIFKDPR